MNKQQLIDKAIDDLKGELPWGTNEACVLVYYPRPSSYAMSHPICIHSGAFEICTRREFEERKAERGISGIAQQHWYDYENQNALRFPPVGEICLVNEYDKVEIVGETKDGYKVYKYIATGFFGMACQITSYKPLDWDGGLESIIKNHLDIEDYPVHKLISAILAAGYRKCDN